ncbi:hypothetical protein SAMN05216304_102737 [Bosea sp. OK403]|uniref:DUF6932 family protein n=1 Tax=Bosea sp. OK403 TaxID=1855286 RepID=UPI0008E7EB28|nr:hypothetical protein [Bosea sp. OK403]SFI43473.1 hypothetical protein SAMN05216304_102737 [Bosea sp. OK403]
MIGDRLALPVFDLRGLLPPFNGSDPATADRSPYFCNMTELCAAFGTSDHRKKLLRNLIAYRALIAADDYTDGLQFIDGSFVENIEQIESRNPSDIDVFSILSLPAKYIGNMPAWNSGGSAFWNDEIIDQPKNKARFSLDCYAIIFNPNSPASLIQQTIYWYSLFSHRRTSHEWKGFAAVPLDVAGDQAALATIGGP